jgi:hypothetical protein
MEAESSIDSICSSDMKQTKALVTYLLNFHYILLTI